MSEPGIGKNDKAVLTIHQNHDLTVAPDIITQIRQGELEVSTTGVSASATSPIEVTLVADEITSLTYSTSTPEETSTVETTEVSEMTDITD